MNQEQFRNEMAALPPIAIKNKWDKHRMALRKHAKNEPVANFLQWSTVNATMFIGNAPYTEKELEVLQSLIEWKDRWTDALKDPGTGTPTWHNIMPSTSGNFIHAALCIHRWETMTGLRFDWWDKKSIFEFGGGYGANCYIMHRLGFVGDYTLFDLPEFSLLQRYYLTNAKPHPIPYARYVSSDMTVRFETESPKARNDFLFVSNAALSEMSVELRDAILDNAKAEHYLIVFQGIWNGINNVDYFRDFATYLGHNPDDCIVRLKPQGIHWILAI